MMAPQMAPYQLVRSWVTSVTLWSGWPSIWRLVSRPGARRSLAGLRPMDLRVIGPGPQDRTRLDGDGGEWRELRVTAEASEMVTVPRAELDALRAEVRRLRREVGRSLAKARMEADPGPGDGALTLSRSQLAEAWGISE
jgi:hypothetical protein